MGIKQKGESLPQCSCVIHESAENLWNKSFFQTLSKREDSKGRKSMGKSVNAESMTSLGFLLFYLSPSIFYPLFCFHSEAVRQKTALQRTERKPEEEERRMGRKGVRRGEFEEWKVKERKEEVNWGWIKY